MTRDGDAWMIAGGGPPDRPRPHRRAGDRQSAAGAGRRCPSARLRLRGGAEAKLPVARILLCTGPGSGASSGEEWLEAPPLRQLRAAGLIATDAFALGIECNPDALQALDAEGQPVPGLHLLGPITRGRLWEVTAVPELRAPAARLAERLAALA